MRVDFDVANVRPASAPIPIAHEPADRANHFGAAVANIAQRTVDEKRRPRAGRQRLPPWLDLRGAVVNVGGRGVTAIHRRTAPEEVDVTAGASASSDFNSTVRPSRAERYVASTSASVFRLSRPLVCGSPPLR